MVLLINRDITISGVCMLLEEIERGKIVYHGSMHDFDNFDMDRIGSESSREMGGWGIYVSDSRDVAMQYTAIGKPKIKVFQLPSGRYLNLDDGIDVGLLHELVDYYGSLDDRGVVVDSLHSEFLDDETYLSSSTNDELYSMLRHEEGSRGAALLLWEEFGYSGIKFSDKTVRTATNYVLFSADRLREVSDEVA